RHAQTRGRVPAGGRAHTRRIRTRRSIAPYRFTGANRPSRTEGTARSRPARLGHGEGAGVVAIPFGFAGHAVPAALPDDVSVCRLRGFTAGISGTDRSIFMPFP